MQLNLSFSNLKKPSILLAAIFAIWAVYLGVFTLTPYYIEGDDASTILYQLFGRDAAIQRAFNPYHSGFDTLLAWLPQHEKTLRIFAFLVSFLAGIANMFLLCLWLLRAYPEKVKEVVAFALLLPFMVPEMLFSSLLINPSQVGFFFCLLGLLAAQQYLDLNKSIYLYVMPLCFLIGIPCRWSLFIFLPLVFGYWIFIKIQNAEKFGILKKDVLFGISLFLSGIAGFLGIYFSGYAPNAVLEVIAWGNNYQTSGYNFTMLAVAGLSLFTPAALVFLFFGGFALFKKYPLSFGMFLFFSVLPFFFLGFDTSYKFLITLAPILVLLLVHGFLS